MTEFKLDTYYDLTCAQCDRTRSRDFHTGVNSDKVQMIKNAEDEGWRVIEGKNFCPICARVHDGSIWKDVKDVEPPVDRNWTGINSSTNKKYMVLTKEGHVVEGYIYLNQYSCSGYAVYCGGDDYFNNVTHWIPERE